MSLLPSQERLGAVCLMTGSALLSLYAASFATMLPLGSSRVELVLSPAWEWISLTAFVGSLALLAGLDGLHARIRPAGGGIATVGLLLAKVALAMQASVLTWEMLFDPVIASDGATRFLLIDGVIAQSPAMVLFRIVFLAVLVGAALTLGIALLRSRAFGLPPVALVAGGAVLYAIGPMVSLLLALTGVAMVAAGGFMIGVALWRASARSTVV